MPPLPRSLLLLTDRFPPHPGGLARSSHRLARHAAAAGARVSVLVLRCEGPPGRLLSAQEGDLHVHRLAAPDDPAAHGQAASQAIEWLHETECFDLLHGQYGSTAGFLAAYHARRFGIACHVSLRGNDVDRDAHDPHRLPALGYALERAHTVGAVSRRLAAAAAALSGRADVRFTPNSVDADLFHPADPAPVRAELGLGTAPVLGFTGELRAKKGAGFLLDAFAALPADLGARLLLVGTVRADERRLLEDLAATQPDLATRIHTVAYLHDSEVLRAHYAAMDVFLAPSLWEGMPNSVLEAMACGRPVLASDAGGLPDLITPHETGWLLGRHVLHRLGDALREVLLLPAADREAVGARAREHVRRTFPPERERDDLLAAYGHAMAAVTGE